MVVLAGTYSSLVRALLGRRAASQRVLFLQQSRALGLCLDTTPQHTKSMIRPAEQPIHLRVSIICGAPARLPSAASGRSSCRHGWCHLS